MRKFIPEYAKNIVSTVRNTKLKKKAVLLKIPVPSQRIKTVSVDLFGPGQRVRMEKNIFIREDITTK